ncbi:hypothetical protein DFH08DRAFT_992075 [Mycena albidolilacea]|uniref:Uncharacterized protein n=1 Tax=Mycena albidolilacea TaxID=1033008 RepID=A0AAD6Z000_9AGAR|nr:hypothetical protein DFH08DRAFT_992075 [Mycena albidolilacea]
MTSGQGMDSSKMQDYRAQIRQALDVFGPWVGSICLVQGEHFTGTQDKPPLLLSLLGRYSTATCRRHIELRQQAKPRPSQTSNIRLYSSRSPPPRPPPPPQLGAAGDRCPLAQQHVHLNSQALPCESTHLTIRNDDDELNKMRAFPTHHLPYSSGSSLPRSSSTCLNCQLHPRSMRHGCGEAINQRMLCCALAHGAAPAPTAQPYSLFLSRFPLSTLFPILLFSMSSWSWCQHLFGTSRQGLLGRNLAEHCIPNMFTPTLAHPDSFSACFQKSPGSGLRIRSYGVMKLVNLPLNHPSADEISDGGLDPAAGGKPEGAREAQDFIACLHNPVPFAPSHATPPALVKVSETSQQIPPKRSSQTDHRVAQACDRADSNVSLDISISFASLPSSTLNDAPAGDNEGPSSPKSNPGNPDHSPLTPTESDREGRISSITQSSTSRSLTSLGIETKPTSTLLHPLIPHPAPLPDGLRKNIENNSLLYSILDVTIAFHDPLCVLQISLILGVQCTQVGAAIWPISSYFEHLTPTINFNSDLKLRPVLKDSLVRKPRRCGSMPRSTTPSLRNGIWPASLATHGEFWDYHVCNVNPSTEIYDAPRSSCLPLDPASRLKLTGVIRWLEEILNRMEGGAEAADFLATYRQQSNNQPQPVLTMGGMANMLF